MQKNHSVSFEQAHCVIPFLRSRRKMSRDRKSLATYRKLFGKVYVYHRISSATWSVTVTIIDLLTQGIKRFEHFVYHALLWTCSVFLLPDKKITLNTLLPSVFMTGVHPPSPQPKSPMWHKREIGVESMFKVVTWLFLALWDIGSSRDLLITANSNRVALIQCPKHFSSRDALCSCNPSSPKWPVLG